MTKNKAIIAVIAVVAVIGAIGGVYYLSASKTPLSGDLPASGTILTADQKAQANSILKGVLDAADKASGAQQVYDFAPLENFGRSGNFGVYISSNGERLADENFVQFQKTSTTESAGTSENAVVNLNSNSVIGFNRSVPHDTLKTKSETELYQLALSFLKSVEPGFDQLTKNIAYQTNKKTAPERDDNYFFTWNDMGYKSKLPAGVEIDREPFIQVGITSNGYIFSYDNTMRLYQDALNSEKLKEFSGNSQ